VSLGRAAGDATAGGGPQRRPALPPEPLPAPALDCHCHLDLIGTPPHEVISAAAAAGITRLVTVGVDLASSRWAAQAAAEHPGVFAAVAIHPNETAAADGSPGGRGPVLAELAELAALPQVRAVGETGLDYYRDQSPPGTQREWFRAHIEIAKRAGKTLMIHDREAHEDVLAILAAEGPPERVVFHCFSGDAAMARRCAEAGYVLSFAGNLTFRNAPGLREAATAVPATSLLVETDAPFLAPEPSRGSLNTPAMAAHTVRCLARLKDLDLAGLCAQLTATGERLFGPW
jgi:TatD DNase family protein